MKRISCLLLAAGDSSRMEGRNKLLLKVDGESFIKRTVKEIKKLPFEEILVVTGHEADKIQKELHDQNITLVHNKNHQTGMHSSIKTGLKNLSNKCDAFFVCLSDQPYFHHETMRTLIRSYLETDSKSIFIPVYEDQRGHPVLFSSEYISEVMREPDGDYGLSYLLKRYPEKVEAVAVDSRNIILDVDSPEDYEKFITNKLDITDPVQEFHQFISKLRDSRLPFVVATVIEVIGSASARTGSKAVFDQSGKNLLGWVGGGCAERFIGEESVKALSEHKTRIVLADLDDEIFGLGVACGGKMRVFLEPIYPLENVLLPYSDKFQNEIRILCGHYGWSAHKDHSQEAPSTIEDVLISMARSIARVRGKSAQSLRLVKETPAIYQEQKLTISKSVAIVGRTRITEALARHFSLLSYDVRAIGPDLKNEDYPSNVKCHCLNDSYSSIDFSENEIVIIGSHTSQDPLLVEKALSQNAGYVGMIGSYKRSVEVLTHLELLGQEISLPLYVPAGLDIDARNPNEIALSVVAEVLLV